MFKFWKGKRNSTRPETAGHGGYYPLYDSPGSMWGDDEDEDDVRYRSGSRQPGYAEWDRQLEQLDTQIEQQAEREQRRRQRWWQPSYWRNRGKLWWAGRIVAGLILRSRFIG